MKRRHLVLGCGVVLALALVVPALGGPLALSSGGSARVVAVLKKARKAAAEAQRIAVNAQSSAAGAQSAAGDATNVAAGAKATASLAQSAVAAAQSAAAGAKDAADLAQNKADAASTQAAALAGPVQTAESEAHSALVEVRSKLGGVEPPKTGVGVGDGVAHEQRAVAECPAGTVLAAGGFEIGGDAAEPHISKPEGNNWVVVAQSGGNNFTLTAFAMCLTH
jgi:hypothetical protein